VIGEEPGVGDVALPVDCFAAGLKRERTGGLEGTDGMEGGGTEAEGEGTDGEGGVEGEGVEGEGMEGDGRGEGMESDGRGEGMEGDGRGEETEGEGGVEGERVTECIAEVEEGAEGEETVRTVCFAIKDLW
jgi:hypothetical protein